MSIQHGMSGPYPLDKATVDRTVAQAKGVYALGKNVSQVSMTANYVGRSDVDLNERLKQWVDTRKYSSFMFKTVLTVKEAYERECELYHALSDLDNEVHPAQPAGTNYTCPVCAFPNQRFR